MRRERKFKSAAGSLDILARPQVAHGFAVLHGISESSVGFPEIEEADSRRAVGKRLVIYLGVTATAAPRRFRALRPTVYSPAASAAPETIPLSVSSFSPRGSPSAENLIGRSPVVGISHRKGFPGEAP